MNTAMSMNDIHRMTVMGLERLWGLRPISVLACAGYADEHWQIYHPHEWRTSIPMPAVTIDIEGHVAYHPDGRYGAQEE